jgi:general secretion pathway protein G
MVMTGCKEILVRNIRTGSPAAGIGRSRQGRRHAPGCDCPSEGFTLIELMLAVAVLTILAMISVSLYSGYVTESRISRTIQGIREIELLVADFSMTNGVYPASLADVGADDLRDAWGQPYQYLNIANGGNPALGHQRKDKFLVPVNSDYDLYSLGADGASSPPFTAHSSYDDIVRANNGRYVGLAEDY